VKVLFIDPNLRAPLAMNHGLAFLSSALKRAGHRTAVITLCEKLAPLPTDDELLTRVNSEKPGLIGFSVLTTQFDFARETAKKIKRAFPHVPLVIGGAHATVDPEGSLSSGVFDYACVGEGERAIVDLVAAIEKGRDTLAIPGIWACRDARIFANPVRPVDPAEALPPEDCEAFDFQRIIDAANGCVPLIVSRGYPLECSYRVAIGVAAESQRRAAPSAPALGPLRRRGVDDVVAGIRRLFTSYKNIKSFVFDDDVFTFDRDYLRDFVRKYREVTDLPFACSSGVAFFDAEVAALLAQGRCSMVEFPIDSPAERRGVKTADFEKAFAAAHAAGLKTSALVMMGLPSETSGDLDDDLALVARLKPARFRWQIYLPFVNTAAYDLALKKGYIGPGAAASLSDLSGDFPLDFGPEHNLKIRRLRVAYPWYVNAHGADPVVSRLFSRLVRVLESLDAEAFAEFKGEIPRLDDLLHQVLSKVKRTHYSLGFNDSTGVISTWNE